jgi:trehalose utilization protein
MLLSQVLPTVNQLSHQDKLRLIHFLLLAVAKEAGCCLETAENSDSESVLLNQLASTEAVVWSPHADHEAVQSLSNLLVEA